MGALLESLEALRLGDHDMGDRVDEVTEDVLRLGGGVAVAELLAESEIRACLGQTLVSPRRERRPGTKRGKIVIGPKLGALLQPERL